MPLNQYLVYETNNRTYGVPDVTKIDRLAQEVCVSSGVTDPAVVQQMKWGLFRKYKQHATKDGVCAGMVCNWAYNYLSTSDPESPVEIASARLLQGKYMMSQFKQAVRQTMIAPDTNGGTANKDAAEDKMFKKKDMVLWTIVQEERFPPQTHKFKDQTSKILDWVEFIDTVPYLLSVEMKDGQQVGRHAMGLLCFPPCFYLLDPNIGLCRFGDLSKATIEINNHFIKICVPNSTWYLKAIRLTGGA